MTWRGAIELSKGIGLSVAAVAGVTGAIYALRPAAPVLSLGVLYVIAVVTVAVFRGLAYAIPVCVASLLTFNFLFLPPVHTFALRDSANWVALAAYLVTAVVVSELATRSRRLARQAVEAETLRQSDAVKTAVLRAVSHDLRSPLTAIRAASDGLENPSLTLDSSDREALWETIRIEVHRLERLVENLLDLSRLDAGPAVRASRGVDRRHRAREGARATRRRGRPRNGLTGRWGSPADPGRRRADRACAREPPGERAEVLVADRSRLGLGESWRRSSARTRPRSRALGSGPATASGSSSRSSGEAGRVAAAASVWRSRAASRRQTAASSVWSRRANRAARPSCWICRPLPSTLPS